jgi:uncharacterized protein (DUF2141 family)
MPRPVKPLGHRPLATPTLATLTLAVCASPLAAGTLDVRVSGIEQPRGEILVALCTADEYLVRDCTHGGAAPADGGAVTIAVRDIPPGRYAVLVLQDLDGDRRLKRNLLGMPQEPVGFGNDASMRFGPPKFDAAAVDVAEGTSSTRVQLRYR